MAECKATLQAVREQEAQGEFGCPICGERSEAHTCEECEDDGYIDVMDQNHYGAVIGPAPCPYGCTGPEQVGEGNDGDA